jgi:hypothetical protein
MILFSVFGFYLNYSFLNRLKFLLLCFFVSSHFICIFSLIFEDLFNLTVFLSSPFVFPIKSLDTHTFVNVNLRVLFLEKELFFAFHAAEFCNKHFSDKAKILENKENNDNYQESDINVSMGRVVNF